MSDSPEAPDAPKPPLTTTTSIMPAVAVLGIAIVMLVVFLVINLIADQGVTKETTTIPIVVGGLERDASPTPALQYCRQGQEVPANITDAFIVPVHTVAKSGANTPNLGAGDFDCIEPMATTGASSGSLLTFFNTELEARGWSLFSRGASDGKPQSLFQKAGSDGFYWEVGVTITKSSATQVDWTFQIYQNSESV